MFTFIDLAIESTAGFAHDDENDEVDTDDSFDIISDDIDHDDDDGNDVDLVVVNQVPMKTTKLVFNGKL